MITTSTISIIAIIVITISLIIKGTIMYFARWLEDESRGFDRVQSLFS